jgi:hypothetical protein
MEMSREEETDIILPSSIKVEEQFENEQFARWRGKSKLKQTIELWVEEISSNLAEVSESSIRLFVMSSVKEKQLDEKLKDSTEELKRKNTPEQIEKRGGRMGRIFASLSDDENKQEEKFNNPSFSSTIDDKSVENEDGNENWMERNETLFDERIIEDSIISVFCSSSFEKEKKKIQFLFSD